MRANQVMSLGRVTVETSGENPGHMGLLAFTLMVVYKNLYIMGVAMLRRRRYLARRLRFSRLRFKGSAYAFFDRSGLFVKRFFSNLWGRVRAPFSRIKTTYLEVKPAMLSKRRQGEFPAVEYLAVLESVGRLLLKILATIFNYAAPVLAAFILFTVIQQRIHEPTVLLVNYMDKVIGYVRSEAEFTAATQTARSRVSTEETGEVLLIGSPEFELMTLNQFQQLKNDRKIPADAGYLDRRTLADILVISSNSDVEQAYGLYINKRFIGAVTDKNAVLEALARIKRENMTGKPDEQIDFIKPIAFNKRLFPRASIVEEEKVLAVINSNETSDEIYVVQDGDTPTGIADRTGVPYAVLKELNLNIEDNLQPGMKIYTQVARPYLSVKTSYTDVYEEEIPFKTVETQNATYARGYRDVTRAGENGMRRVKARITTINGFETERVELTSEILRTPVDERVVVGVNDPGRIISSAAGSSGSRTDVPSGTAVSSTGFIRPVPAGLGRITCYLNGYWGHTGIDIAVTGGTGTPILASASGTVVLAKYSRQSYGNQIIIDHGNGYTTLYAHNSALYVSVGDKVAQGQVIAAMGRTGNASGVHCHFEVRYNGKVMNPVDYVGNS